MPNDPAIASTRTPPTAHGTAHDSPGETLEAVIAGLPPEGLTLAVLRDLIGQDGLLLFAMILTLVFMIPVSIPGVSTVFGAAILLIGICRLFGQNLWLPRRLAERLLPAERLRAALCQGRTWLRRLERISRPHRLHRLAGGGLVGLGNNAGMILGAVLLMAPFGLIPFSNTLPALALLLLALGLLQRDGVCILLGHLSNLATMAYFAVLLIGGTAALREVVRRLLAAGA
ncbi:MAG: exopolysaccharide biosynthesis protein [Lentisphaerae bacterium]|nr:exopolysaccharide biosynthesis protein [Lentisphaerota bacterium]